MHMDQFVSEVLKTCKYKNLDKRQIADVVGAAFKVIQKAVQKDKRFCYPKFGAFVLKQRKGRNWRNPQTGEAVSLKTMKSVGFRPALALKRSLNGPGKTDPQKIVQKAPGGEAQRLVDHLSIPAGQFQ